MRADGGLETLLAFLNMPAGGELLVIALVALIALGPEQLPQVMRKLGALSNQLRSLSSGLRQEFLNGLEESAAQQNRAPRPNGPERTEPFDPSKPIVPHGYAEQMAAQAEQEQAGGREDGHRDDGVARRDALQDNGHRPAPSHRSAGDPPTQDAP
jgi:Sec-independent protein translocase protein TatA